MHTFCFNSLNIRLEHLVAHEDIISIITKLIDQDNLPHLLLYGPPVRSLFNSNKIPRAGSDFVVEDNEEMIDLDVLLSEDSSSSIIIQTHTVSSTNNSKSTVFPRSFLPPVSILLSLQRFTNSYSNALILTPIITKSMTAGFIFALSDYTPQTMNSSLNLSNKEDMNCIRTISSGLLGLLYYGSAAHVWYQMIFQLLPGT